ncbi:MAG: hypothetical protein HY832_02595 [Candidatus Aenigmarchaeota archaeon]|nr:hypothetical protein [Candidatus Aenigmarchaeota archaeon]
MNKRLVYGILFVFLLILTANTLLVNSLTDRVTSAIQAREEGARPARIEIIKISLSCFECKDIEQELQSVKNANVNITSEKTVAFGSQDYQDIVKKYDIKILPTFILTGEINKTSLRSTLSQLGETKDNVFIFAKNKLPYYNISRSSVMGLVNTTIVYDSQCAKCFDMETAVSNLKQQLGFVGADKKINYQSGEGKQFANTFRVQRLPSVVFTSGIRDYEGMEASLNQINATIVDIAGEKFYVLSSLYPPYVDAASGKTVGLVSMISLTDNTCTSCYNVSIQKSILQRFGLLPNNETNYDINSAEGRVIIAKYNITKIPTIILSREADYYSLLKGVWPQVGTIEDDGSYVFREMDMLAGYDYRDLVTGNVTTANG